MNQQRPASPLPDAATPSPDSTLRRYRLAILALALLFVVGAGAWGLSFWLSGNAAEVGVRSAIGGPFDLVDATGKAVGEADILGKPTALFFGYTSCPNVCPTTLSDMTVWLKELGPAATKLNFVFVSIDPERDTAAAMAQYLTAFDPRIRGFTGTPDQIDKMAKTFRVYYRKVPQDDGSYLMDHSAGVYLMDAKDQFVGLIDYQESKAAALTKLKRLVGG